MWPFKAKPREDDAAEAFRRRYKERPMAIFFEAFVLDVIGKLPEERSKKLESFPLHEALKTRSTTWRESVREALHLSATIEIAILDLWYTNRDNFARQGDDLDPEEFSRHFIDEFLSEGSKIDVWPADALQQAKYRIARQQSRDADV